MGRPTTPYYLLDVKIRPTKRHSSTPTHREWLRQNSPPAYDGVVRSAVPSPSTVIRGTIVIPSRAATSVRREGRKHPDRRRASCPAFLPSHGAAPRRRLIVVAFILSFLIPPPPPAPRTSSFYLLPNAGTLARRGGGGGSRVLRQSASRGARAHRVREGDWAADPRRRRPHHPWGRGSCGQLMHGLQTYWRPVVYCLIGVAGDWLMLVLCLCSIVTDSCDYGEERLRQEHPHKSKELLLGAHISSCYNCNPHWIDWKIGQCSVGMCLCRCLVSFCWKCNRDVTLLAKCYSRNLILFILVFSILATKPRVSLLQQNFALLKNCCTRQDGIALHV